MLPLRYSRYAPVIIIITFISDSSNSSNSSSASSSIVIIIIVISSSSSIIISISVITSRINLYWWNFYVFPIVLHQCTPPFFWWTTMEVKLHNFFLLSLPSHFMENFLLPQLQF